MDLAHLSVLQRQTAEKMLAEEADAFARNEQDLGCIPSLQMHLTLNDPNPVQKTYMGVPHHTDEGSQGVPKRPDQSGLDHKVTVILLLSHCLCPKEGWHPQALC